MKKWPDVADILKKNRRFTPKYDLIVTHYACEDELEYLDDPGTSGCHCLYLGDDGFVKTERNPNGDHEVSFYITSD